MITEIIHETAVQVPMDLSQLRILLAGQNFFFSVMIIVRLSGKCGNGLTLFVSLGLVQASHDD